VIIREQLAPMRRDTRAQVQSGAVPNCVVSDAGAHSNSLGFVCMGARLRRFSEPSLSVGAPGGLLCESMSTMSASILLRSTSIACDVGGMPRRL
jgi:hypothetical protein